MVVNAVKPDTMELILKLLTKRNEIACRVSLLYGLRIGDVLALKTEQVKQASVVIYEEKTGKRRKIVWTDKIRRLMLKYAGDIYVFPHRLDKTRHRTRQAVWKDINKASKALRIKGNVGTHSMRKNFAIKKYKACGDMRRVSKLLNHSNEAVTRLYALAEEVDIRE